jgi:fructose/tagatose bisphosphate aldolase
MDKVKYFIGPMSKNIVDAIVEFCANTDNIIGLIPSRRQVEWDGGYVNNWTTEEFSKYVTTLPLQRDHGGPGQGNNDDDGYESLAYDAKHLQLIHIDPWKKYPNFTEGLKWTADMIEYCDRINSNLIYEIGTEEAIRPFEANELERLILALKQELMPGVFDKIKYLVIQSGTSLKGTNQTGNYNAERLKEMIAIARKYKLISKEHNGDYIPVETIKEKFDLGLDCINIAPEFGLIETQTYLDEIKDSKIFDRFWQICYDSKKWVKWVNPGFDPYHNKEQLIKISGHYVLSNPEFISDIKSHFPGIDEKVKANVTKKLNQLYGYPS